MNHFANSYFIIFEAAHSYKTLDFCFSGKIDNDIIYEDDDLKHILHKIPPYRRVELPVKTWTKRRDLDDLTESLS